MNLLVVDFDYFFPFKELGQEDWQLYDWGHSELHRPWLQQTLWQTRAAGFFAAGKDLPGLSGLEKAFWKRFRFAKRAHGYVSDSNFFSMHQRVRRAVTSVHLYDAHHDCGYGLKMDTHWTCANWALWYLVNGADVMVNYPTWRRAAFQEEGEAHCFAETIGYGIAHGTAFGGRVTRRFDPGGQVGVVFDKVHLCRSGTWVPPWHDRAFAAFAAACPVALTALEATTPRPFDEPAVFAEVALTKELWRQCQERESCST